MHRPVPHYREDRGHWFVRVKGKYTTLASGPRAETEAEAWAAYHRLMASLGRETVTAELTVAMACNLFLDHAETRVKHNSYVQYAIKLKDFSGRHGKIKLDKLTDRKILDWLASHNWSDSTKRGGITAVKVMLGWCVAEGYLEESPAARIKRPKMGRRLRTIDPSERNAIRAAAGPELSNFLDALGWTGCRPGEMMRLSSKHIDWEAGHAALKGKTTAATGDLVEFPLVPPMLALCQRLAEVNATGPLFRNTRGKPWTPNGVRCAMRRLRMRMSIKGVTAYTYRHSFATDALERGVPVADVAALMNHKDIRTTMGYGHLKERRAHLLRQSSKVTSAAGSGDTGTGSTSS